MLVPAPHRRGQPAPRAAAARAPSWGWAAADGTCISGKQSSWSHSEPPKNTQFQRKISGLAGPSRAVLPLKPSEQLILQGHLNHQRRCQVFLCEPPRPFVLPLEDTLLVLVCWIYFATHPFAYLHISQGCAPCLILLGITHRTPQWHS